MSITSQWNLGGKERNHFPSVLCPGPPAWLPSLVSLQRIFPCLCICTNVHISGVLPLNSQTPRRTPEELTGSPGGQNLPPHCSGPPCCQLPELRRGVPSSGRPGEWPGRRNRISCVQAKPVSSHNYLVSIPAPLGQASCVPPHSSM